jgi:hypothetical protein
MREKERNNLLYLFTRRHQLQLSARLPPYFTRVQPHAPPPPAHACGLLYPRAPTVAHRPGKVRGFFSCGVLGLQTVPLSSWGGLAGLGRLWGHSDLFSLLFFKIEYTSKLRVDKSRG